MVKRNEEGECSSSLCSSIARPMRNTIDKHMADTYPMVMLMSSKISEANFMLFKILADKILNDFLLLLD